MAVANALTTKGPFAIPLAITIGALGAAQLAKAIAVPLPKYEKGTENAKQGWSIYGEKGMELVTEKSGRQYLTPSKPTLTWLEGGEKITPHHKLSKTLPAIAMSKPLYVASKTDTSIGDFTSSMTDAISIQTYQLKKALNKKNKVVVNNRIDTSWGGYINKKIYNR